MFFFFQETVGLKVSRPLLQVKLPAALSRMQLDAKAVTRHFLSLSLSSVFPD